MSLRHRFVTGEDQWCVRIGADGDSACGAPLIDPIHLKEGEGDDAFVTLLVSREVLATILNQWSPPVQIMITLEDGDRYVMAARLVPPRRFEDVR